MTTIINSKEVPDNVLSFFMGVLVVKYIIDGDITTTHLSDGRIFRKYDPDPRADWYELQPCLHPITAILSTEEGTHYCYRCADDSLRANIAAGVEA